MGINGHKDYLPHFRFGSPKQGGDEYPDGDFLWDLMWFFEHKNWEIDCGIRKIIYHNLYRIIALVKIILGEKRGFTSVGGGSWHGNDTLWRTILDINRAFFYYNPKKNVMSRSIQRKYFCIVDGLVGGEKESPLAPSPKKSNIFICGENPVAIDSVVACLMNFDYKKIKTVYNAYRIGRMPLTNFRYDDIKIKLYDENKSKAIILKINDLDRYAINFQPSKGFKGCIENN